MSSADDTHLGSGVGPGKSDPKPDYDEDAVAQAIVDEIQRPKQPKFNSIEFGEKAGLGGRFVDDDVDDVSPGFLPEMDLPGFGEPYGPDAPGGACGEDRPHFCDCAHHFSIGRTCSRSVCPRCAAAWILNRCGTSRDNGRDVAGIVGRLVKAAKMKSSNSGGKSIKFHHVVMSPPDHWMLRAENPYKRTEKVCMNVAKNVWGAAGVSFYHPFRGDGEATPDPGRGTRGDLNEWKKRILSGRSWDDVRGELDVSPHFHLVVASEWVPGGDVTKQVHEETGWVIKRITKKGSKKSIADLEDLASVVTYCLSHTGIRTGAGADGSNLTATTEWGEMKTGTVYADDRVAADLAVRKVAPRTVGIPSTRIECKRQVPEGEQSATAVDAWRNTSSPESTASSTSTPDPADDMLAADGGTTVMVPCEGRIHDIKDLEHGFLNNQSWRDGVSPARLQTLHDLFVETVGRDPDAPPPPD